MVPSSFPEEMSIMAFVAADSVISSQAGYPAAKTLTFL